MSQSLTLLTRSSIARLSWRTLPHKFRNIFTLVKRSRKLIQKGKIKVFIHRTVLQMLDPLSNDDDARYYEVSAKQGLRVMDILQELATKFPIDILSFTRSENRLPFTIVVNHYKPVGLADEVH